MGHPRGVATFRVRPGLGARAAAACAPQVTAYAQEVGSEVRRRAPDGKAWLTSEDERVRPSHRDTGDDTQPDGIPGNLRYQLPRYRGKTKEAGVDLGREPRDPALPLDQRINCRCESVDLPGAVARAVTVTPAVVAGLHVRAAVSVKYPRVAESENPDPEDEGGGWFRGAAQTVAARRRAAR